MTNHFGPSLDKGLIKRFFKIFIAAVLLVDNDDNRNSYFAGKLSYRRERDVIRRTAYADICVCRKRKLELILTFKNAGNVKSN